MEILLKSKYQIEKGISLQYKMLLSTLDKTFRKKENGEHPTSKVTYKEKLILLNGFIDLTVHLFPINNKCIK